MEKEFVPYAQSLQLRELGFDEPCLAFYNGKFLDLDVWDRDYLSEQLEKRRDIGECPQAPTFSQAFKWFREKYSLLGCPQYFTGGYYCYTINDMKGTEESNRLFTEFSSYEEAELACLDKLIELAENNKQ